MSDSAACEIGVGDVKLAFAKYGLKSNDKLFAYPRHGACKDIVLFCGQTVKLALCMSHSELRIIGRGRGTERGL